MGSNVVVLEYHPHMCPGANPRETALSALDAAGYQVEELFYAEAEQIGMLWAWR